MIIDFPKRHQVIARNKVNVATIKYGGNTSVPDLGTTNSVRGKIVGGDFFEAAQVNLDGSFEGEIPLCPAGRVGLIIEVYNVASGNMVERFTMQNGDLFVGDLICTLSQSNHTGYAESWHTATDGGQMNALGGWQAVRMKNEMGVAAQKYFEATGVPLGVNVIAKPATRWIQWSLFGEHWKTWRERIYHQGLQDIRMCIVRLGEGDANASAWPNNIDRTKHVATLIKGVCATTPLNFYFTRFQNARNDPDDLDLAIFAAYDQAIAELGNCFAGADLHDLQDDVSSHHHLVLDVDVIEAGQRQANLIVSEMERMGYAKII